VPGRPTLRVLTGVLCAAACSAPTTRLGSSDAYVDEGMSGADRTQPEEDADVGVSSKPDARRSDAGTSTSTTVTAIAAYCAAAHDAELARMVECLGGDTMTWVNSWGVDTSTCTDVEAAAAAGVLSYDATAAAECLADIAIADCAHVGFLWQDFQACQRVFVGVLPVGAECRSRDLEYPFTTENRGPVINGWSGSPCTFDAYCDDSKWAPWAPCTNRCVRNVVSLPLGAPCVPDRSATSFCAQGACVTSSAGSSVCTFLPAGAVCPASLPEPCMNGLICPYNFTSNTATTTCLVQQGIGGPCDPSALRGAWQRQCLENLFCAGVGTGSCAAERRIGAPCVPGRGDCDDFNGLYCSTSHTCTQIPFLPNGATCLQPGGEEAICINGYCRVSSGRGVCVPQLTLGSTCAADIECASLACSGGICVALAGLSVCPP
jgi:hypothetical protein